MKTSEAYRGCTITIEVKPFTDGQVWARIGIVPITDEAKIVMGGTIDGGKGDIRDLHVKDGPDPLAAASADALHQAKEEIVRAWARKD